MKVINRYSIEFDLDGNQDVFVPTSKSKKQYKDKDFPEGVVCEDLKTNSKNEIEFIFSNSLDYKKEIKCTKVKLDTLKSGNIFYYKKLDHAIIYSKIYVK